MNDSRNSLDRAVKEIDTMLLIYGPCSHTDCDVCYARQHIIRDLKKLRRALKAKPRKRK